MKRSSVVLAFTLGFILSASYGHADWPSDPALNLPVCTAPGHQYHVLSAPDGAGGVLFGWIGPNQINGERDIFAQRITASGEIAPGWPVDGVDVCANPDRQDLVQIVTDGDGGAILVWLDNRHHPSYPLDYGDIFAQHIRGDGTTDPGWPADGALIWRNTNAPAFAIRDNGTVLGASDGSGGAVVVWAFGDYSSYPYKFRIYAQGVLPGGALAWGDTAHPAVVCDSGNPDRPVVAADALGNVFVAWSEDPDPGDLHAQRLTSGGSGLWGPNGLLVAGPPDGYGQLPSIAPDGSGGAIIAWDDRYMSWAQYFTASGAPAPGWPAAGVLLADSEPNHIKHAPSAVRCTDGGAFFS